MKKMKSNSTIKTYIDELDQAGQRFKKTLKGHRVQLYRSMQTAQHVIVKCLERGTLKSQFIRAVQQKRNKNNRRSTPFNLSLEAVARATGASSSAARKLASKRAGVLDYLRERGVHVKDTAATVKKEGVEKLYSEWSKKKKEAKASAEGSNGCQLPSPPVVESKVTRNDREVILPLWVKLSDRDQLLAQELGAMLSVLVSRVSEDDGDLQVKRVMVVNNLDEAGDWED